MHTKLGRGPWKIPPSLVLSVHGLDSGCLFYLMLSFGLCYGGHLFVLFSVLIGLCQYTVGVSLFTVLISLCQYPVGAALFCLMFSLTLALWSFGNCCGGCIFRKYFWKCLSDDSSVKVLGMVRGQKLCEIVDIDFIF